MDSTSEASRSAAATTSSKLPGDDASSMACSTANTALATALMTVVVADTCRTASVNLSPRTSTNGILAALANNWVSARSATAPTDATSVGSRGEIMAPSHESLAMSTTSCNADTASGSLRRRLNALVAVTLSSTATAAGRASRAASTACAAATMMCDSRSSPQRQVVARISVSLVTMGISVRTISSASTIDDRDSSGVAATSLRDSSSNRSAVLSTATFAAAVNDLMPPPACSAAALASPNTRRARATRPTTRVPARRLSASTPASSAAQNAAGWKRSSIQAARSSMDMLEWRGLPTPPESSSCVSSKARFRHSSPSAAASSVDHIPARSTPPTPPAPMLSNKRPSSWIGALALSDCMSVSTSASPWAVATASAAASRASAIDSALAMASSSSGCKYASKSKVAVTLAAAANANWSA